MIRTDISDLLAAMTLLKGLSAYFSVGTVTEEESISEASSGSVATCKGAIDRERVGALAFTSAAGWKASVNADAARTQSPATVADPIFILILE
jgi:hypothetical protein